MDWYPQALFTAEQACRRRFYVVFGYNDIVFSSGLVLDNAFMFGDIFDCTSFWKHQIGVKRKTLIETCRILSWALIWTRLVSKTMSNISQCIVYIWYIWYIDWLWLCFAKLCAICYVPCCARCSISVLCAMPSATYGLFYMICFMPHSMLSNLCNDIIRFMSCCARLKGPATE